MAKNEETLKNIQKIVEGVFMLAVLNGEGNSNCDCKHDSRRSGDCDDYGISDDYDEYDDYDAGDYEAEREFYDYLNSDY